MPFPQTLDELRNQGYKLEGEGQCRGCGVDIEWWETPAHKKIPMDYGTAKPHWETCTERDQFKKTPEASTSKVTSATVNWEWLREQAKSCHCTVCRKITGR